MIACTSRQLVLTCNKVIVAIANKLAIIAWAVAVQGSGLPGHRNSGGSIEIDKVKLHTKVC